MNSQLETLYENDVADRKNLDWSNPAQLSKLQKEDRQRKTKVQEIIAENSNLTAQDYHHAALIFQHGDTSEDYKQANQLAQKAMEMGDESAKWLYAATLDRWLLSTGQPQKFGTQFRVGDSNELQLAQPINPQVTDEERAQYNVPPLAKALETVKKKYEQDISPLRKK